MTDIFTEAKEKVMPTWAVFKEDGDAVQGTYVGKILGQRDGYDNEQVIYQLLQGDGSIINVGFGLNKKFINQDMDNVKWGQIVGFKYKGKITVKDRMGKPVEVKDFALHQDPKIVDAKWLEENKGNMPQVVQVQGEGMTNAEFERGDEVPESLGGSASESNPGLQPGYNSKPETPAVKEIAENSLTEEDKLAVIEKLAKDKLDVADLETVKVKVMETFSVAFIPINYDSIIEKLKAL